MLRDAPTVITFRSYSVVYAKISSSDLPSSARRPANRSTMRVAAVPLGCLASGKATSSATTTAETLRPNYERAFSAARPKLSLSPV